MNLKDNKILSVFGTLLFNDEEMKTRLPQDSYSELQDCIINKKALSINLANDVAKAMKEWAMEKGATHYTHWFQPLTGVTAEKHDSFLDIDKEGNAIIKFNGKALIKGEPDASSFPNGGIRATFEARGYTAWDPTSYAFVKDGTLYIPTAFCSFGGEALDKKTPLLRSMEVVEKEVKKVLSLFGKEVNKVTLTVGAEQEYFLIDKGVYEKRLDLINCGKTLFGAKAPKGQELEDHYFGKIKNRVSKYMAEVDKQLWELGVLAKTKHNEVAPAQHELAPIFSSVNIATDHNQLTMSVMKSVADKFNMVCLLNEKPFEGVNGSGKHNNWSISTDMGENLFEPGSTPSKNTQFLLFLMAVIKAVDDYQDLLRISVASASNDHRLGANEAPPAIVSMFIGQELEDILEDLMNSKALNDKNAVELLTGVSVLPHFKKDKTDRNRTSPFAFTGNKFEFRMLGSMQSISEPNVIINTAVAKSLKEFYGKLEGSKDITKDALNLIKEEYSKHKRIVFNGNNYSEEWVTEAKKRGLCNYKSTVDAVEHFIDKKNIDLFTEFGVYTEREILARYDIKLESYCKIITIESSTMLDMLKKQIVPAVIDFKKDIGEAIIISKQLGDSCDYESDLFKKLCEYLKELKVAEEQLINSLNTETLKVETLEKAIACRDLLVPSMKNLRSVVDKIETLVDKNRWPLPNYSDMLYSVRY